MQRPRTPQATRRLHELLRRDHTLHGGILVGLDGCLIEIQARALHVLREPPGRSTQHKRVAIDA
jgi:hypothetical protein